MNTLTYKGYTGRLEVDTEAGIIFGRVLGIRDVITFQGVTAEEAAQAFRDSVDDYLAFCAERGEEPDKPFSGKLAFRTTPEHHRRIAAAASLADKSINAWMEDVVVAAAESAIGPQPPAGDATPAVAGRRTRGGNGASSPSGQTRTRRPNDRADGRRTIHRGEGA